MNSRSAALATSASSASALSGDSRAFGLPPLVCCGSTAKEWPKMSRPCWGKSSSCGEQKKLVWRAWLNFARGVLETMTVMHCSREKIIGKIALEGEEHLKRALETGKGVLALSAHLGSFTLIGGRLAAAGYPFSVIVKQPADKRFAQLIDDYRAQLGIHTISAKPRREAAREILKALRNNRIVLIIADEFKSGDVMVDFFQMKAPAPRGPATLALRTGAVTLPMFAVRGSGESVVLTVVPSDSLRRTRRYRRECRGDDGALHSPHRSGDPKIS